MTSYDPKLSFELDPYQITFIKQESADRVREAVTRLFASEGFHPSDARTYPAYQGTASSANHRVLQVLGGHSAWVLLRTSPSTLLAEESPLSPAPRLSLLCKELHAPAFLLKDTVFENDSGSILLEVLSTGEALVSGSWWTARESKTFCGLRIDVREITPQTSFMSDLIAQVDSAVIAEAFRSMSLLDRPTRFEALADELTPALVNFQNYEISRNFAITKGETGVSEFLCSKH